MSLLLPRTVLFQLPRDFLSLSSSLFAMLLNRVANEKETPVGLTQLEDISQLSPLVQRVLGQNPGLFTLQGTNTYLVGRGAKKILIDTGEPDALPYLNNLIKALETTSSSLCAIVATHWHLDHTGGIAQIRNYFKQDIPVYKMRRTDGQPESGDGQFVYVVDGHQLSVEGATLRFISTPGHTSDHAALWLEEEEAIFSGDCVLGEGTTIFENLATYMKSLQKLLQAEAKRIYPGHGPVVEDPKRKILEYIEHRNKRELEILEIIAQEGVATSMQITNAIYKNILPGRRMGALLNVRHHLLKLLSEGKISDSGLCGLGMYKIVETNKQSKL